MTGVIAYHVRAQWQPEGVYLNTSSYGLPSQRAWEGLQAALPDRARVLSTEPEFTSALWPFMAQGRGIEVRCVEPGRLGHRLRRAPASGQQLRGSGIMAAARAGLLRTSWHVYNDERDVERALAVLSSGAAPRPARGSAGA